MTALGAAGRPADGEPPDLRLAVPALAAWGAAWATTGLAPRPAWVLATLLAVAAVSTGLATIASIRGASGAGEWRRAVVAAGLLCAAAAATAGAARVAAVHAGPVPPLAAASATVTAEVVVTSDPQISRTTSARGAETRVTLRARLELVVARGRTVRTRAPVLVLADERWRALVPSQRVRVVGRLGAARTGADLAAVLHAHGAPRPLAGPALPQRLAEPLRAGLREAVHTLPAEERGLVPGLVVGDTSAMPPGLEEAFRATGLTHLTAVSGANVAIVLAVVLGACRWLGLRVRAAPVLAAAVMAGFVVLARPQPSVLRAAVMGLVALAALGAGRARLAVPALAASVLLLVLLDPFLARSYGFALSVLATGAILLVAPPWRTRLARLLPGPLADAVAVPLAAQVVCAPVVVLLAAGVSLVAVPANVLVAPAVAPTTVLGVLAAAASPVLPPVAALLGRLAGLPAAWIVTVAERGARVPGGVVPWPRGVGGAALLVVVTAAVVGAAPALARSRVLAALAVGVLVVALLPLARGTPGWPPAGWHLVACAVGQGDALVLAAGPRTAVVVDAGPAPPAVDRCLRDLGVRRVPLLLLTHFHADHVDGLAGVLRGRSVGEVLVSPLAEPPDRAARVRREAVAARLPVRVAAVGEEGSVGGLRWRTLWPSRIIRADESAPNDASVVLRADGGGVSMLLAGDVEPLAAQAVARTPGAAGVDVLKVPHHGSRLQAAELLDAARPRVALVSVGVGNDYGHPAAQTLAALRGRGAQVARTDTDGDLAVAGPAERLRLVRRGSPLGRGPPGPGRRRPLALTSALAPAQAADSGAGPRRRSRRGVVRC